jgi:ABC-type uncharacterized transport system permease subunit
MWGGGGGAGFFIINQIWIRNNLAQVVTRLAFVREVRGSNIRNEDCLLILRIVFRDFPQFIHWNFRILPKIILLTLASHNFQFTITLPF